MLADFYANVRSRFLGCECLLGSMNQAFRLDPFLECLKRRMNRGCGCFSGPPTRRSLGMGCLNWTFIQESLGIFPLAIVWGVQVRMPPEGCATKSVFHCLSSVDCFSISGYLSVSAIISETIIGGEAHAHNSFW